MNSQASLAKKRLYILLASCFMQVVLLLGLAFVQSGSDNAALISKQERHAALGLWRVFIADLRLLCQIDRCLAHLISPDESFRMANAQLVTAVKRVKELFRDLADKRGAAKIVSPPKGELSGTSLMYLDAAKMLDSLGQSAGLAMADADHCLEEVDGPEKETDRGLARKSWYLACEQLEKACAAHQDQWRPVEPRPIFGLTWLNILICWSTVNLLATIAGSFLFLRDFRSRLLVVLDNTERLARGAPLHRPIGGVDEIAMLDQSFHRMAQTLERSRYEQTAIIENAQDLICSTSAEGKIISANYACERLLGLKADELVDTLLMDIIDSGAQGFTADKLLALASGEPQEPFETRAVASDGTVVDLLCSVVWAEEDRTAFWVFHDMSHKKMADRLQREVVDIACQELKAPIIFIAQFHEALSSGRLGELKEGAARRLDSAIKAAERMLVLVKDLEDCHQLDSGNLHLRPCWCKMANVFERTVAIVSDQAAAAKVSVVSESTALNVFADPDRLLQILINLTTNALKFSPAGGTVTLACRQSNNKIEVMVRDQGIGIEADMLDSIFDRFSQVRQSDSKVKGGSGLGLAICKSLVQLHGGTIKAESEVGVGTVFSFTMPAGQPATTTLNASSAVSFPDPSSAGG